MEYIPIKWDKMEKGRLHLVFLGTYFHTVDERNRLSIPKKFRDELGFKAILTRGLDGCLFLYNLEIWEGIVERIRQTPLTKSDARSFARHVLSGAMEVEIDRLGRVIIPSYLKEFAAIEKDIAVLAVGERIEIWSKQQWGNYSKDLAKRSDEVAERLSESGI